MSKKNHEFFQITLFASFSRIWKVYTMNRVLLETFSASMVPPDLATSMYIHINTLINFNFFFIN